MLAGIFATAMLLVPAAAAAATGVWAWGMNSFGQLGDGQLSGSSAPTQTQAGAAGSGQLTGVTQLAGGLEHSVALLSNGTVLAWGDNTYGELGNGSTSASYVPVAVSFPQGTPAITAVAAGENDSFALDSSGDVWGWGANTLGQLGAGTTASSSDTPVRIVNANHVPLTGITAIAAGRAFVLALSSAGNVYAWGDNSRGELGNGQTGNSSSSPAPVQLPPGTSALLLRGITAVAAGMVHAVAVGANGVVYTWGDNSYGQLGDGQSNTAQPDSAYAVTLRSPTASAIAAGGFHTLAITTAGGVVAWGDEEYGQLGNGVSGSGASSDVPLAVQAPGGGSASQLSGVSAVSANLYDSYALTSAGGVLAWGNDGLDELGDGSTANQSAPVKTALAGVASLLSHGSDAWHELAVATSSTGSGPPVPSVSALSPSSGSTSGGTSVTITGSGFNSATGVFFGLMPATSFSVGSDSQITAVAPAASAGTVDVTVVSPGGTSATSSADQFTYLSPGTPSFGPSPTPTPASPTSEVFTAVINPEGLPTTAWFEYGLDSGYGAHIAAVSYTQQTPPQQVGSDFANHTLTATVTGLVPHALYHYRVVSSNSAGTVTGPDQTFTTALAPPPPPPINGRTTNLAPVKGVVLIELPHTHHFIPLTEATQIPFGTIVDATRGTVSLTAARTTKTHGPLQTAQFYDGEFLVTQKRGQAMTNLRLVGGVNCSRRAAEPAAHAAKRPPPHKLQHKLWGNGHGQFQTQGSFASASVQGTIWETTDYCDSTWIFAKKDTVLVKNFVNRKSYLLHTGQSYYAYYNGRVVRK